MLTPLWSESAFGVVHKSWTKMQPKLARVSQTARPTDTLARRMNVNYAQWRYKSGYQAKERAMYVRGTKSWEKSKDPHAGLHIDSNNRSMAKLPEIGRKHKEAANAAATGHANAQKKNRWLP